MFDRRLNAFRPDLAERALEGRVEADRFADGEPRQVTIPVADLRPYADPACGIDSQLLFGETVQVFDHADGWSWVKSDIDSYVGYVATRSLGSSRNPATHIMTNPRSFAYDEPDMRRPVRYALSMGSRLTVSGMTETRGTEYLVLEDGGAVIASHCRKLEAAPSHTFVAIAARLLETPYLWGGRSAFGLDCSGLVQLSMLLAGRTVMRDSDMQASGLGTAIDGGQARCGDLLFWKGHVAILEQADTIIHANGHTMSVARETLADAIARIRPVYGEPTGWRRP